MSELADRPLRLTDEGITLHWWRMVRWFMQLRLIPRWHEHISNPLTRIYKRFFFVGLTFSGKIILFCSLIVFLLNYRIGSNFLLLTAALGLSMLLWSAVLGYFYRPRVSVQRQTPTTAVANVTLTSQINVLNEGSRGLYNYCVREMTVPYGRWPREWHRPHHTLLPAGQPTSISVTFEPRKRGVLLLSGLAVQSYFPFFLTRHSAMIEDPAKIYVLPPSLTASIPSLRHIAEQVSKQMTHGRDNARNGPSLEYAYSRQYQTGDSLRRLDHRASGRRGEPMSKIFEGADQIRRDKVYLVVDTTLAQFEPWQRRPTSETELDDRLALAVEIGLSAQNEGFSLAAISTTGQWKTLDNLLEFYQQISTCEPQRAIEYSSKVFPDNVLTDDGLHILVIGRWGAEVQDLVEKWQRAGVLVLVFLLAESSQERGALPEGIHFIEVQPTGVHSTEGKG